MSDQQDGGGASEVLSKNALKRELKNKQKEEERRRKEEDKLSRYGCIRSAFCWLLAKIMLRAGAAVSNSQVSKPQMVDDEDMDPTQYFENRLKAIAALKIAGSNPYPHKFHVSISILEYIENYQSLTNGAHLEDVQVSLAGRIMSKRSSSSKLFFYDLHGGGAKVQVMADARTSEMDETEFSKFHSSVKRGDVVGVIGYPGLEHLTCQICMLDKACIITVLLLMPFSGHSVGKSKRGELSLFPRSFVLLSHCLHMMPRQKSGPGSENTTVKVFRFFFGTFNVALVRMVKELTGGYKLKYHAKGLDNDPIDIDFTPPFRSLEVCDACAYYEREKPICVLQKSESGKELYKVTTRRIDMIEELEKMANLNIPKNLSSDEANVYLADACKKYDIKCPPPQTQLVCWIKPTLFLVELVGHFLEETCVNPAFIINHPEIMSPLAKWHRSKPGLTERFELFINKHELCNAYTELNDPVVQRQRFADQLKDRQSGDDEAMALDETFCTALEYGLPPTGGWGLGIDRLTMLLTDSQNIKVCFYLCGPVEVLLFPAMRPQDESPTKGTYSNVFKLASCIDFWADCYNGLGN
ncbi:hypothetical protein C3L33_05673, partial [Rhododendron williamsianum]